MPDLLDAVGNIKKSLPVSAPCHSQWFAARAVLESFRERIADLSIKVIENETWDSIGHADRCSCR